jgi:hypothetical protein
MRFLYPSYSNAAIRGTHCGWCEQPFKDNEAVYKGFIPYEGIAYGDEVALTIWNTGPMCESCARERYKHTFGNFKSIANCEICGRPVRRMQQSWHITCCESHRQKLYRPGKRNGAVCATCEGCGQSFTPKRADSKYCSNKCRQCAYRERSSR